MEISSELPVELPVHHVSTFDFDDAFRDDDDSDPSFQFSPDAIREELAKSMSAMQASWQQSQNLTSPARVLDDDLNVSVSTLDINNNFEHPAAQHQASSYNDEELEEDSASPQFSQISLSAAEDDFENTFHRSDDFENTFHRSDNLPNQTSTDEDLEGATEHPYPSVIIDVSKEPSNRVSISSGTSESDIQPSSVPSADDIPHSIISDAHSRHHSPSSKSIDISPIRTVTPLPTSPSQSQAGPPSVHPGVSSTRKPGRSSGPSALEKVRSQTRPSFLPPKLRSEDDKHLANWQHMMKLSRIAAEKKRKALKERRMAREKAIENSLHIWEKELLPDWKIVNKNPALRKLWWKGIPSKLRPIMWERAVGNDLALSKDHYRICLSRAKRALSSGVFPQATLDLVEQDILSTLPALHIFDPINGPLYGDLKDMLCAWVVSRSDEGLGYTFGAAKIAGMVLINMPCQQGFIFMRNLLDRHLMRSFFGGERAKDDVEAYYRIFDTLLADAMPKIYFNFKQHQISPAAYLPDWLIPLFLNHLPFEACARVWDVLLLEGDSFLYRAALGILAVLEPRLFFPDKKELLELLRGENKAALEVAKREGRPLDGGKYEIYGLDEEALWERIDDMNDWWKESTWTRLIQRELPDL